MHAPPESIEIFVFCNAIFSLREKFLSKMFDPAIVIFMPIYVYVSSSTSAAGSGCPYFVFFLDISCRYTLFLSKYHKNSYEISEQMSKSGFFPIPIAFWSGWDFKKNRGNPAEIGKILQSSYQTAALPNIFGKCHALQLA